jgi:alpha-acetolactate decarboxylase
VRSWSRRRTNWGTIDSPRGESIFVTGVLKHDVWQNQHDKVEQQAEQVAAAVTKVNKAKKALTRLRTIANKLIRELQRKLPTHNLFETYQKDFLMMFVSLVETIETLLPYSYCLWSLPLAMTYKALYRKLKIE